MQKYYANAHIIPTQSIIVKKEPFEIKQEKVCESVNHTLDASAGSSNMQPYAVSNAVLNAIPNDLQFNVDSLTAEKNKLIGDFLALKAENQRILYDLQKKDEILLQKEKIEKELKSKFDSFQSENLSIVNNLNKKIVELQNSEKNYTVAENVLKEQLAAAKQQLLMQTKQRDEFKNTAAGLIKENKVLKARLNQIKSGTNSNVSDPVFDVGKIINHKMKNKKRLFLVRWEGFDEKSDSWEPENNLKHLQVYKQYLKKHKISI